MRNKAPRQSRRYPVVQQHRECGLCVITFKDLAWKDHTALLVDISRHGAGIESHERIDPGFVWFRDRVGGHKGGVLMWNRPAGDRHRGGVRFVPFTRAEEKFIDEQIALVRSGQPLQDPVSVITTLMESLTHAGSVETAPPPAPQPEPLAPSGNSDDDDIIGELRKIVSSA